MRDDELRQAQSSVSGAQSSSVSLGLIPPSTNSVTAAEEHGPEFSGPFSGSQSDDEDYFVDGSPCTADEFPWPASDHDSDSPSPSFAFSSDSEDDSEFDGPFLDSINDSSDEEQQILPHRPNFTLKR